MNNQKNLQRMISNMTKMQDPAEILFSIFAKQNPQLYQMVNYIKELNLNQVKGKVQELAQRGAFTREQLKNFETLAKQAGFNDKDLDEIEENINFRKNNRW